MKQLLIALVLAMTLGVTAYGEKIVNAEDGKEYIEPSPPAGQMPEGAISLFDGSDLSRWEHWDPTTVDEGAVAARPGFGDIVTRQAFANYQLHLDFLIPPSPKGDEAPGKRNSGVFLNGEYQVLIADTAGTEVSPASCGAIHGVHAPTSDAGRPAGEWQSMDLSFQQVKGKPALISVWLNGEKVQDQVSIQQEVLVDVVNGNNAATVKNGYPKGGLVMSEKASQKVPLHQNFTIIARFNATAGTIVSKTAPEGRWVKDGKALFLRDGRLVFDMGWVGKVTSRTRFNDGEDHTVVVQSEGGHISLYVDGHEEGRGLLAAPDHEHFRIKIGAAGDNFGGDLEGKTLAVHILNRALPVGDAKKASSKADYAGPSDFAWQSEPVANDRKAFTAEPFDSVPGVAGKIRLQGDPGAVRFANVWIAPLSDTDHAAIISGLNAAASERGAKTYESLCVVCHGTQEQEGALPTALRFGEGEFKNGSDPLQMYRTIKQGYGQMVAQAWMKPQEIHDVIHYIRDVYLKEHNPSQYVEADDAYLASLPMGMDPAYAGLEKEPDSEEAAIDHRDREVYRRMDYGPFLTKTYEVAPGNIAYKAIAQRLDGSAGGVSAGKMFMVFDHDTMRIAAGWKNTFCDWVGIMFDGSHGTHTSIGESPVFVNPVGPGWANPETGSFEDPRSLGRDGKPYGPLPRDWAQYKGLYRYGDITVLSYSVDSVPVLEQMTMADNDAFARVLNIGSPRRPLVHRIAPTSVNVAVASDDEVTLRQEDGFHLLDVPAGKDVRVKLFISSRSAAHVDHLAAQDSGVVDLATYTQPGPTVWKELIQTEVVLSDSDDAYVADEIVVPYVNPWDSWMRVGGMDFFEDGDTGAICTWMGDVWTFSGLMSGKLTWKRMAAGLFQPLGLKIVNEKIYVTCRDQIALIHDSNGDGEADFIEAFNSDHQVTEHFHEFAMGLQTDKDGNFYYAKSACHARPAVVPHHGTLIRVSKDGQTTDVIANGFRAANGVCINDDGTFFVTDQEGHWTPKNRINLVQPDVENPKFYGNFLGYHSARSDKDKDMEKPLVWLTNEFDRSPAELVWVASDQWGPLSGSLLNISYGYGRLYVVPHETVNGQVQGGASKLMIPDLPSGMMRGRFHPEDGQLYTCGLFAWASSRNERPGGVWRIRYTGAEVMQPVGLEATGKGVKVTFCSRMAPDGVDAGDFEVKSWDLLRSAEYGSKHLNERPLTVSDVTVSEDGQSIFVAIEGMHATRGMSIKGKVTSVTGVDHPLLIHNTIHNMN